MPKNKQSELITGAKLLNIRFINKYIINSEIRRGGYSGLVNYPLLLSIIVPSAPPQLIILLYEI